MHRHRSLPATLPRARVDFRLQPTPAAAPTDQLHHPVPSRLVCHPGSRPMRTGSPPGHNHRGRRNPGVLALNGAWNATLRCAAGAARSLLSEAIILTRLHAWQLKQQNKSERAISDRLPAVLDDQQPFHSSLSLGYIESRGPNHAVEKKDVLDGRCIVPLGSQSHSAVRQRTGSGFRQTVPTEILVTGEYLRAQPVRRGLSQPAKPAGEPSVQIRLALPARNCRNRVRDPPDSRTRCFSSVQRVRTAQSRGG